MTGSASRARPVERLRPARTGRAFFVRLLITIGCLMVWFWTQSLIGSRGFQGPGIGDQVHAITNLPNLYLHNHPTVANALLIVSSGIIDLLGVFLLSKWIVGGEAQPFLGLVIVLGLRQIMQALVSLPAPPNAIWHYPGFPSLLVTYGVANDYFFSGHTAIAVLAATEVARLGRRWLTGVVISVLLLEILTVLVLRAHYTMDVFTGLVTGLYAEHLAGSIVRSLATRKTVPYDGSKCET